MPTRPVRARSTVTLLMASLWSIVACAPATTPTTPSPVAAAVPPGWTVVRIADPSLSFAIPPGWQQGVLSVYRSTLDRAREEAEGPALDNLEWTIQRIDDGIIKLIAGGPSATERATATAIVSVETGDFDVEAAADRRTAELDDRLVDTAVQGRTPVELPIGHAVRIERTGGSGSRTARSIEYVVLLPDGRTLLFSGGAPESDEMFSELFAQIAQTLRTG